MGTDQDGGPARRGSQLVTLSTDVSASIVAGFSVAFDIVGQPDWEAFASSYGIPYTVLSVSGTTITLDTDTTGNATFDHLAKKRSSSASNARASVIEATGFLVRGISNDLRGFAEDSPLEGGVRCELVSGGRADSAH